MAESLFSVGGLASGMDTQSIIDKLVQLESQPLTLLQQRQSAYRAQVSVLGDLASRLGDLDTATKQLATGGVLAFQAASANASFSASPTSQATAGSYDVRVTALASAAKWRSGPFGAADAIRAGQLTITTGAAPARTFTVDVTAGESLADVADAIRRSGAPISAAVLNDGTSSYLSLTATSTGYEGSDPASALGVSFGPPAANPGDPPPPPPSGVDPTAGAATRAATNAAFTVDGLAFTRRSNDVTDAVPGVNLTLKGTGAQETLSVAADTTGTQAQLQKFVDAYNGLMAAVQKQLAVTKDTDRSRTLAGDSTVRGLSQALQAIGSTRIAGLTSVRSLADLGVKTQRDGSLTIDAAALASAVARNPAAVNAVFADAASGVAGVTSRLVTTYTASGTGLLSLRQSGLERQISSLDDQAATLQNRIDAYREGLVKQFTAMESVVGQLKSVGNFLTMQDNQNTKK